MLDESVRNPRGIVWRELVGKSVLVGLTVRNSRGVVIEQRQLHGQVASADPDRGLTLSLLGREEGRTCSLPPDLRSFEPAAPGDYRLRSTGEIVHDPDFLANWIVDRPDA